MGSPAGNRRADPAVILQRRLAVSGDGDIARVGSDLGDFHQERIQADYRLDDRVPENKNNAVAAVVKAKAMIATLEGCALQSARWKSIQASIAKANVSGSDGLVGSSTN